MPWGDWQFWVVTAAVVGATWFVLKPLFSRRGEPCGPCGGSKGDGDGSAARLTVEGRDR